MLKKFKSQKFTSKFIKTRKSVITKLIFFCCLLLIIPMIFISVYLSYSITLLNDSLTENNNMSFYSIKDNLDDAISKMNSLSTMILSSHNFDMESLSTDNDKNTLITNYSQCMNNLANYTIAFDDIDIMIYLPDTGYIITPKTCNTIDALANAVSYDSPNPITGSGWADILDEGHEKICSSKYLSYKNFGQNSIVFSFTKVNPATKKTNYKLFFSIPSDKIFSDVTMPNNSSFMIVQKNGTVSSVLYGDLRVQNITIGKNLKQKINNSDYLTISAATQGYGSSYYALVTPYDSYFNLTNTIRLISLILVFIILIAGVGSIVYIENKTFRPMQTLVKGIHDKYTDMNQDNEFLLINDFVKRLSTENTSIKTSNQKIQEYAKGISLHNLLTDVDFGLSCKELINQLVIGQYKMTLLSVSPEIIGTSFEEQVELLLWAICNVTQELFEDSFEILYSKENYSIDFMIYYGPSYNINKNDIPKLANQLYKFFDESLQVKLSITMSEEFTDPLKARNIHHIMEDIMAYRMLIHSYGVTTQAEIISPQYTFIQTASEYREKFHNVLVSLNSDELKTLCDELFNMYNTSGEEFNLCKYHILNIISPMLISPNQYKNKLYENAEKYIISICRCTDLVSLYNEVVNIMNSIMSQPEYLIDEKNDLIINEVKSYINEHYTDEQLNVAMLAEHVNLSSKYLGTLYRKLTAEGIPQYINRVRISKAKDLLVHSHHTIEEISNIVGFGNTRSFQRNFKQLTGLNPNEFKQMNHA